MRRCAPRAKKSCCCLMVSAKTTSHARSRNFDFVAAREQLFAALGLRAVHEAHADHLRQRRAVAHRGQFAHRAAVAQDRLAAPGEEIGRWKGEDQEPLGEFAARRGALAKRLLLFTFPATELFAWGGEPILRDGAPVGELTSVGYSAALGQMVGMGFVHGAQPETAQQLLASRYEIEVSGVRVPARASLRGAIP